MPMISIYEQLVLMLNYCINNSYPSPKTHMSNLRKDPLMHSYFK